MAVILNDTFTAADSTALSSHVPDSGGVAWSVGDIYSGGTPDNLTIQSNKTSIAGAGDYCYRTITANDFTATVEWTPAASGATRCGIIFHDEGSGNHYKFVVRSGSPSDIRCVKTVAYSESELVTNVSYSWTLGQTYTLKLICNGSSIKCYVNDVLQIDTTDGTFDGTTFGLARFLGDNPVVFDNLLIDDGESGNPYYAYAQQ